MRVETEALWAFHGERLRDGVPPERLIDRVAFSQHPPLRLSRCLHCTHIYRNPRERRESLTQAYDGETPDDAVLSALFETQRTAYRAQAERLRTVAGRAGRGIEIGCYVGGFLAAARQAGWDFTGVDVSAAVSEFVTRKGFAVTIGEITDVRVAAPVDAVTIWNTFEQLYDVHVAVDAARHLLRDSGMFVVRIPNGDFYARWRRRLHGAAAGIATRLLVHNNLLTFPYRQGFTESSLQTLFHAHGFEITHVTGDTLVPIADSWTTRYGAIDERVVKRLQRMVHHGWRAPWVEVYARRVA